MAEPPTGRERASRLAIALAIGLASGLICCWYQLASGRQSGDLIFSLIGARAMLGGQNPYSLPDLPGGLPLFYPLTAFILAIPFLPFPPEAAAGLFFGGSSALLAYLLCRDGRQRLLLFLAAPYWQALQVVQWSPLLCAVWLSPLLLLLVSAKPNIGLAVLVSARWLRAGVLGLAAIGLCSLLIRPQWPLEWLRVLGGHPNATPLLTLPGLALPLAALRWRDRRARLLLAMAAIPQRLFYDQLLLFLIPQSARAMLALVVGSWLSYIGWFFWPQGDMAWAVVGQFIPALVMVLLPAARAQPEGRPATVVE